MLYRISYFSNSTSLLFTAERPNELSDLDYELISALQQVIPYLQRGLQ
jgi:hypothetical protein